MRELLIFANWLLLHCKWSAAMESKGNLQREKENEKITDVFDENSVVSEGREALCSPGDSVGLLAQSHNTTNSGGRRRA